MTPESSTQQKFLERRLWQNLEEPSRLNFGLKIRRMQKIIGPKKNLLVPTPTYGQLDSLVAMDWSLTNALLDMSKILNSKCPKLEASKG